MAVRMSPYTRVDSNYCGRDHGLNIAQGGTIRNKNNKFSITTASPQKITTYLESYVSGLFQRYVSNPGQDEGVPCRFFERMVDIR